MPSDSAEVNENCINWMTQEGFFRHFRNFPADWPFSEAMPETEGGLQLFWELNHTQPEEPEDERPETTPSGLAAFIRQRDEGSQAQLTESAFRQYVDRYFTHTRINPSWNTDTLIPPLSYHYSSGS